MVINGGKLVQNVDNHGLWNMHQIKTKDEKIYSITSTHHQMHYPFNLPKEDYEILAYAYPSRATKYEGFGIDEKLIEVEPEITYFPKTNCLCIQGHPEYMPKNNPVIEYLNKLINNYLK